MAVSVVALLLLLCLPSIYCERILALGNIDFVQQNKYSLSKYSFDVLLAEISNSRNTFHDIESKRIRLQGKTAMDENTVEIAQQLVGIVNDSLALAKTLQGEATTLLSAYAKQVRTYNQHLSGDREEMQATMKDLFGNLQKEIDQVLKDIGSLKEEEKRKKLKAIFKFVKAGLEIISGDEEGGFKDIVEGIKTSINAAYASLSQHIELKKEMVVCLGLADELDRVAALSKNINDPLTSLLPNLTLLTLSLDDLEMDMTDFKEQMREGKFFEGDIDDYVTTSKDSVTAIWNWATTFANLQPIKANIDRLQASADTIQTVIETKESDIGALNRVINFAKEQQLIVLMALLNKMTQVHAQLNYYGLGASLEKVSKPLSLSLPLINSRSTTKNIDTWISSATNYFKKLQYNSNGCWSAFNPQQQDYPLFYKELISTGKSTIRIAMHPNISYAAVVYDRVRVTFVFDRPLTSKSIITAQLHHGHTSTLLHQNLSSLSFTHHKRPDPVTYEYLVENYCAVTTEASNKDFIKNSPFTLWDVSIKEPASIYNKIVGVRFEFELFWVLPEKQQFSSPFFLNDDSSVCNLPLCQLFIN